MERNPETFTEGHVPATRDEHMLRRDFLHRWTFPDSLMLASRDVSGSAGPLAMSERRHWRLDTLRSSFCPVPFSPVVIGVLVSNRSTSHHVRTRPRTRRQRSSESLDLRSSWNSQGQRRCLDTSTNVIADMHRTTHDGATMPIRPHSGAMFSVISSKSKIFCTNV